MALKHFLKENTYTCASNLVYDKKTKICTVVFDVFLDDSKTNSLISLSVHIDGAYRCISLSSLNKKIKNALEVIELTHHYLIDDDAEGEFRNFPGHITKYNNITKVWDKWLLHDGLIVFVEDENKYYQHINYQWKELKDFMNDERLWQKWLVPEIALSDDSNPVKQMYKFMKTLEKFKDCEDA